MKSVSSSELDSFRNAHLNLQQVIATDALVVHLVVCVIGISAVFVLDESKAASCQHCFIVCDASDVLQSARCGSWCRDIAADKTSVSSRMSVFVRVVPVARGVCGKFG